MKDPEDSSASLGKLPLALVQEWGQVQQAEL